MPLGSDCNFYIQYSLTDTKDDHGSSILLFRIRRPEQKLLQFKPKKGFLAPGSQCCISVCLSQSHFVQNSLISSKLLVKAVVLHLNSVELNNSILLQFDKYWQQGLQENDGKDVRKIVDVVDFSRQGSFALSKPGFYGLHDPDDTNFNLPERLVRQSSELFSNSSSTTITTLSGVCSSSVKRSHDRKAHLDQIEDNIVAITTRILFLSGDSNSHHRVVLEAFGPSITDETLPIVLKKRIEDCESNNYAPTAIEITESGITSWLWLNSVGKWRNSIRHLTVNSSPRLEYMNVSLNVLQNLVSLNLCGNGIKGIPLLKSGQSGLLNLPHLQFLDISHNNLQSLDFLQLLFKLRTLTVSHNNIASLLLSINTLVPLAHSLRNIDLSNNPVCSDLRYAEEVLSVLPNLHYFDTIDLRTFGKTYSANSVSVNIDNKDEIGVCVNSIAEGNLYKSPFLQNKERSTLSPSRKEKEPNITLPQFPCDCDIETKLASHVLKNAKLQSPSLETRIKRTSVRRSTPPPYQAHSSGGNVSASSERKSLLSNSRIFAQTQSSLRRLQSNEIILDENLDGNVCGGEKLDQSDIGGARSLKAALRKNKLNGDTTVERARSVVPVSKPTFGFSKPFIERRQPSPKNYAPLYEETVHRLQGASQKSSRKGTFSRSTKGLPAEWYPMDYSEVESIRKRGNFREVIGDKPKMNKVRSVSLSPSGRRSSDSHWKSALRDESYALQNSDPISICGRTRIISPNVSTRSFFCGGSNYSASRNTGSTFNSVDDAYLSEIVPMGDLIKSVDASIQTGTGDALHDPSDICSPRTDSMKHRFRYEAPCDIYGREKYLQQNLVPQSISAKEALAISIPADFFPEDNANDHGNEEGCLKEISDDNKFLRASVHSGDDKSEVANDITASQQIGEDGEMNDYLAWLESQHSITIYN